MEKESKSAPLTANQWTRLTTEMQKLTQRAARQASSLTTPKRTKPAASN